MTCQVVYLQFWSVLIGQKNIKFITVPQILPKNWQWHNKGTELYWLYTAADSIVDAISFTKHIIL